MVETLTGRCLCGAATFVAAGEPIITAHCHCVDCRKSSGTGHCTHVAISEAAVTLSGELRGYGHPADSGNIVTRYFCPQCGSAIHSTNSAMAGMVFLRASALDDLNAVTPQMVVYASRAPQWDTTDSALPTFALLPDGGAKKVLADVQ